MLHLFLLRHAKAVPGDTAERDSDRRLETRGERDAALMGRFLDDAEWIPDLVLTSQAVRARATAELAIEAASWRCPLRETPRFYESSVESVVDVVRSVAGDGALLLVGHEPTWSMLASSLIGGGELRLPTAGVAYLAFDLDEWAETAPGSGVLRGLVAPAMLAGLRTSGKGPERRR
jgi:phosphohistidine phosphatase